MSWVRGSSSRSSSVYDWVVRMLVNVGTVIIGSGRQVSGNIELSGGRGFIIEGKHLELLVLYRSLSDRQGNGFKGARPQGT